MIDEQKLRKEIEADLLELAVEMTKDSGEKLYNMCRGSSGFDLLAFSSAEHIVEKEIKEICKLAASRAARETIEETETAKLMMERVNKIVGDTMGRDIKPMELIYESVKTAALEKGNNMIAESLSMILILFASITGFSE